LIKEGGENENKTEPDTIKAQYSDIKIKTIKKEY